MRRRELEITERSDQRNRARTNATCVLIQARSTRVVAKTTAQSDRLEALQKRALRIILHPITFPYNTVLAYCEIESLKSQRHNFKNKFFKQVCHPENCLNDLLPPKRDPSLSLRLWHSTVYRIPQVRTYRYCSFINYALKKYQ